MMMAQESSFFKAMAVFDKVCQFIEDSAESGRRIDEVERELQRMMNEEAREFLEAYARKCGDGDQGETVSVDGRQLKRSSEPQKRRYLSIFGEVTIHRYVYSAGEKKPIEYAPLDARLGLPAGEISYVLEDYQQRLCVQNVFAKSTEDLKAILGTGVPVGTAERMNRQMAEHASSYQLLPLTDENVPPPSEEGELLVVASDGKGVPIRRTLEERLQQEREAAVGGEKTTGEKEPSAVAAPNHCSERKEDSHPSANQSQDVAVGRRGHCASRGKKKAASGKGTKERRKRKGQKQMAYVGAVYTIDRFRRTADDVLDEVARRRCQQQRPRPQNKRVWGEMTTLQEGERINGRSSLFVNLAVDCYLRDPDHEKTLICLMDGEEPLWTAQRQWLPRAVEILDFFHAMEHLWTVARQFETGTSVERFVEHHARMFLEGKVDYAVRNFRRLMKERQLRGEKRREVAKAIKYFRHNRSRMQYHEYLAQGYPIGSGAAEGTCRNLVKDRLELSGMKWEHAGAQSMIYLRALYLNDEWNDFVTYRVEREQEKLYGSDTIYSKLSEYRQAA